MKVIFMEPETPGNIGALARAMNNFGFKELILINPQCEVETGETRARAKHAYETIRNARILPTLDKIEGEIDHLIGTTGSIPDSYSAQRSYLTPKQLKENSDKLEGKTALILGREGTGLTNEELDRCSLVIHVPTNKEYPIMNITHAAVILLYELRHMENTEEENISQGKTDTLLKYFNESIDKIDGIRNPEEIKKVFEKTIHKSFPRPKEINSLITAFREINENLD